MTKQNIKGISLIIDEERKIINKAMLVINKGNKSQDHWCKYSNGHIYCVTECGGPMQKSVCPECKEEIGGTNYANIDGTSVVSEMDDSTHLAWSDGNNM